MPTHIYYICIYLFETCLELNKVAYVYYVYLFNFNRLTVSMKIAAIFPHAVLSATFNNSISQRYPHNNYNDHL